MALLTTRTSCARPPFHGEGSELSSSFLMPVQGDAKEVARFTNGSQSMSIEALSLFNGSFTLEAQIEQVADCSTKSNQDTLRRAS